MSQAFLESLFSLSGKVAVVIGGTGELCGAMAEGMAGAGAEVVLVGRNKEKADSRLAKIAAVGGKAWFLEADVSEKPSFEDVLRKVLEKSGKVDIVVNGAGVNSATPFFDISEDEYRKIFDLNYKSVFQGCQVFGKYLVERGVIGLAGLLLLVCELIGGDGTAAFIYFQF